MMKETDPTQNIKSNVGKNKEPRKKVMILGDSMVKGLNECVKIQSLGSSQKIC